MKNGISTRQTDVCENPNKLCTCPKLAKNRNGGVFFFWTGNIETATNRNIRQSVSLFCFPIEPLPGNPRKSNRNPKKYALLSFVSENY